ncbi:MAG: DNA-directed RNA polymerase subunit P [Candidatus Aenigmarchaeota archaeon]|nr:DNA-directed RNA polymerase subunit P [Candidatus Aenigmarchaeota archaeon]
MYKCIDCGREVELDLKGTMKIQCSYCGYRILKKLRPNVTKRVIAR